MASKKFENHAHMVAIYTVWYNWIRIHKSLRVTPALAAALSDRLWNWEEAVALMDADQPTQKRGPYKARVAGNSVLVRSPARLKASIAKWVYLEWLYSHFDNELYIVRVVINWR